MESFLERNNEIQLLRKSGKTLKHIGNLFGITRERVRQICFGIEPEKHLKIRVCERKLPLSLEGRIDMYTQKTDSCWLWTGTKSKGGYGRISFNRVDFYAHRARWITLHGDIPEGLEVCHTCDTPDCTNPEHLFLGTHRDNMLDREHKNRGNRTYKLNKVIADRIRSAYFCGDVTQRELASLYHVTKYTICSIINGRSWS
jgi:hypothetical protein